VLVVPIFAAAAAGAAGAGCADQGLSPRGVPSLTLTVADTLIAVGETTQIISSRGAFDTHWGSNDISVATVSDGGRVRGWSPGRALISADWDDPLCQSACRALHAEVWITVVPAAP
jgi:hypothetical protein